jgi:HK97 family phage major capsid protein
MALKALLLRSKLESRRKALEDLRAKDAEFQTREAELTASIEEVQTDEERAQVEELVNSFEAEQTAHRESVAALEREIEGLEEDLQKEEEAQDTTPPAGATGEAPAAQTERSVNAMYEKRFAALNMEQRTALVQREDVSAFLAEIRSAIREKRAIANVGLTIPDVYLELIRHEVAHSSKLLPFVNLRSVGGKTRQNIAGAIPEAVWTEMCASINELTLAFNQIEMDGYKVGGYIAVCNAALEDSDVALAGEIVTAIGGAIGKALDKAIPFGTGTKMPLGFVTRLKQESQPANWGANAPAWTDLHTSNIQTLNIDGSTGAAFFSALIEKLAIAKPWYNADGLFWIMNRKTHLHIMAKALAFDSNAALQANTSLMPIIGGRIVEFEDDQIPDNWIGGGFFDNYLLAERAGIKIGNSDAPFFLQDMTAFKATARYDGKPVFGEAFVVVRFDNTAPATTATFPEDYANADMNDLTIVAAAGTAAGDTVLTVSGTIAQSSPVLKYRLGTPTVNVGDALTGTWTDLTSGTTQITAAAGKKITVVELDGNNRVVSSGTVVSVPKAS